MKADIFMQQAKSHFYMQIDQEMSFFHYCDS